MSEPLRPVAQPPGGRDPVSGLRVMHTHDPATGERVALLGTQVDKGAPTETVCYCDDMEPYEPLGEDAPTEQPQADDDSAPEHVRARLMAVHGRPEFAGWRNSHVVTYRHADEASAQAFARFNAYMLGHLVTVERDHDGWLEVVDMSAAMEAAERGVEEARP